MGLLGGFFNKKNCAICGGEIGLLGNRKLEDGNLCKDCARKLSPWFSERRHSTVAQIAGQLQYREDNLQRIPSFRESRRYGTDSSQQLIIDDSQATFMVTSSNHWMKDNPDIIDYACVTGCRADIREDRHEVRHPGPDGHEVPFEPHRFRYDYDFGITIMLNHPYFDDITFTLRTNVKDDERAELDALVTMCEDIVETMTGTRPDYAPRVPARPPFCMKCGNELPAWGAECRFCSRPIPPVPMPMPHGPGAPMPHRPEQPMRAGGSPMPQPHQPQQPMRAGGNGPQRGDNGPRQGGPGQREQAQGRPVPNKPEVKGERGPGRDRPDMPPRRG